jgi:hypothetical protein
MVRPRNENITVHRLMGEILDERGVLDTETIYYYVIDNFRNAPSKRSIAMLLARHPHYEQVESNKRRVTLWQRRV